MGGARRPRALCGQCTTRRRRAFRRAPPGDDGATRRSNLDALPPRSAVSGRGAAAPGTSATRRPPRSTRATARP